jgi:hypothetical protein
MLQELLTTVYIPWISKIHQCFVFSLAQGGTPALPSQKDLAKGKLEK